MNSYEEFRRILGSVIYHARRDIGSIVVLRLTFQPDAPTEDHYLRICMCNWRLGEVSEEWAHSESTPETIDAAISRLLNRELREIRLWHKIAKDGNSHGATLLFQGDVCMTLAPHADAPSDYKMFVTRDAARHWITYLSDGSIETEDTAEPGGRLNAPSAGAPGA
jgi:hypothetical protein